MIEDGKAPHIKQPEEGATYDPLLKKDKVEVICSLHQKDGRRLEVRGRLMNGSACKQ